MPHDLDQYEPRKDDDREEAMLDEDKVYCVSCGEVIGDDDLTAIMKVSLRVKDACTWIHRQCVDEAQDAAESFAPRGTYEWKAEQRAFLAGIAWEKLRQLKENKS